MAGNGINGQRHLTLRASSGAFAAAGYTKGYIVHVDKAVHNRLTISPPIQAFERVNPAGARDHRYRGGPRIAVEPPEPPILQLFSGQATPLVTANQIADRFHYSLRDVRRGTQPRWRSANAHSGQRPTTPL